MATEIFIEPELENLQDEANAAEWFEICSELKLSNQIALADKSETKQAPPYAFCDPKTKNIIEVICPRVVNYKDYRASTIPTDVLKEIQKAEKHGWYMEIEIAYDDQSPDPFVMGVTHNEYKWRADRHLIARWGNELLPFEELERKAIARMKDKTLEELNLLKSRVEYAINNPDAYIRKGLAEGRQSIRFDLPF